MADISNLERMGRELKCPICLSLLNNAVSLTCNHVFCNLCIEKSMKSASNCPVCKVPYRRREIRPAPHMDNLVMIYKSMEVSSGVNIFVSQTAASAKVSGDKNQLGGSGKDHEVQENNKKSKSSTSNSGLGTRKKCKRKGSNRSSNSLNGSSNSEKPSFPTKKRVQLPQHPPSETPTRAAKSDGETADIANKENMEFSEFQKEKSILSENGEPVFSPFFWLREEEDAEKCSQHTDGDHVMDTPPDAPCFSDIKDSDNDLPSKLPPNKGASANSSNDEFFDSEMFEWTQRACSPELYSSPNETQVEDTDACCEPRDETKVITAIDFEVGIQNGESIISEKGTEKVNIHLSSSGNTGKKRNGTDKSTKRARKATKSTQSKRPKKLMSEVSGTHKESPKLNDGEVQEKFNSFDLKDKTSEVDKCVDAGATETLSKDITAGFAGAGTIARDSRTIYPILPDLPRQEECSEPIRSLKNKKKSSKKTVVRQQRSCTTPRQQRSCTTPARKLKARMDGMASICNKASSADPSPSALTDENKETSNVVIITRKSKVNNNKKPLSQKKVKFSEDSIYKDNSGHASQTYSAAKESRTSPKIPAHPDSQVRNDVSNTDKASDHLVLRRCEKVSSKIQCAFCLSPKESEASGVMVHYLSGKPVDNYQTGGSGVIHAHTLCIEWAPNVYFEDDNVINLESELARSRRIKCCFCGTKGAALGCYEKSCRKSFHVPCAKSTPQCRWDHDNFVALCPLHASSKLPQEVHGFQAKPKRKCAPKSNSNIHKPKVTSEQESSTDLLWKSQKKSKDIVICCSALTNEQKETVSEFERMSGITVLKNWDSNVTHVIASTDENGACRRTLKFLMGVLEGKWILSIEWIKACINFKKLVDEQQYEIEVDIHGIRNGPRLGRQRLLNKEPKIFSGSKFYFTGDFAPSYKGYLHDLVIAAGGTVLNRKPISGDQDDLSFGGSSPTTFVIYSIELPDKCVGSKKNPILSRRKADAEALASSTGAVAASNSWILNSIAGCKLQNL